jgi:hypothetical protein
MSQERKSTNERLKIVTLETIQHFKHSHICIIPFLVSKVLLGVERSVSPKTVSDMEFTKLSKPGLVIKYSFLIFCLVFLVIGVAIFAAGIYLAVTGESYEILTGSSYTAGAAIIIVCGILTVAIAVVGVIGCLGQFRIILLIFSAAVVVVVILELAAGIYGFVRRDELIVGSTTVREAFLSALNMYLPPNDSGYNEDVNDAVDFVQDGVSTGCVQWVCTVCVLNSKCCVYTCGTSFERPPLGTCERWSLK